jgi:hypothetical protein
MCVVAERTETEQTETRRRWPDVFTLLCGLVTLFVASYVLTDGRVWVPRMDVRWLLAGGALLVGVLMLASSLRGGRRKR